jgi:asparagine synthase (glutamine-hydrolysing)
MCGISGSFNVPRFRPEDVGTMIDTIGYRGPDEQGVKEIGPCLLGHARLAVVDPENGHQPMSNTDDTVWVVFNGEIYNFVELREDLKAKGYVFKSRCDTEVLVHLWREKGEEMVHDLIGMFAFFLWDTKENRGILARDRQGIKPCYIMEVDQGFAFASEIKALLALPGCNPSIDDIGLNMVHVFNYCLPPRTCYEGISHLEPGSYLRIDGRTQTWERVRYWTWPFAAEKADIKFDDFAALLDDAIRLQMRFDVKGGMFLSGGVDSSIIAAHLAKRWNASSLRAYGLDTVEEGYGEFSLSQHVARQLGIDLVPVKYGPQIVPEKIEAVLHHADQPCGDFSFFLIRKLCEQAHEDGLIVVFNGDGPDEVLSGFGHNSKFFRDRSRNNFPLTEYFRHINYMLPGARQQVLQPDFLAMLAEPIEAFEEVLAPWRDLEPIEQIAAYETGVLGPGNNLVKTDRMGAGMSIEGRSPFLDHRVSEAFTRLPVPRKTGDGIGKLFLKEYGLRFFEKDLMFRGKSMPTMPIGDWIRGELYDWARDSLGRLDPTRYKVEGALAMLEEHKAGATNRTRELRTLLMAANWSKLPG